MPPRLKDVARAAGVSVATASLALHKSEKIHPETRRRVAAAASRLQYRPSGTARSLVTKKTHAIGLVISDVANPFFVKVVRGVEDGSQATGYSLFLCNTDEDPAKERQYLQALTEQRVDGILIASAGETQREIQAVQRHGIPVVLFDRRPSGLKADTVTVNNVRGALEATQHLLSLGHREIAIIHGPRNLTTGTDRLAGYLQAHRERGLAPRRALIWEGTAKEASGYSLTHDLIKSALKPTALLTCNNLMAQGAYRALRELGVRIPEDMSFIAYDDLDWAELVHPAVTTVAQPAYALGMEAISLLIQRITGKLGARPRRIVLEPTLCIRDSCAARAFSGSPPIGRGFGNHPTTRERPAQWKISNRQ